MHHIEAMKESLHQFEFLRLNQLLDGLLYGALGAELPHAGICLRHPRYTWERFGGAMSELNFDTLDNMLRSVKHLGATLCHLTVELEVCDVTMRDGTDLRRLKAMTQALFNPWEFSFLH